MVQMMQMVQLLLYDSSCGDRGGGARRQAKVGVMWKRGLGDPIRLQSKACHAYLPTSHLSPAILFNRACLRRAGRDDERKETSTTRGASGKAPVKSE